jgi:hypothetical protein
MTIEETAMHRKETLNDFGDELARLEGEIGRQRLIRERATYNLEQAIRERDRIARHLESMISEEGAA